MFRCVAPSPKEQVRCPRPSLTRMRAKKFTADQRASKLALEQLIAQEVWTGRVVRRSSPAVSAAEISAAAAAAIAQ
jgi:hypothetical protein